MVSIHEILPPDVWNEIFLLAYKSSDDKRMLFFSWVRVCKAWKDFAYEHLEEFPDECNHIEWHRKRNHTIVMKLPKLKKLELYLPLRDDTDSQMYLETIGSIPSKPNCLNMKFEHFITNLQNKYPKMFEVMDILRLPKLDDLKSLRMSFSRIKNKRNALYFSAVPILRQFFDDLSFIQFQKLEHLSLQIPFGLHLNTENLPRTLKSLELDLVDECRYIDPPLVVLDLNSVLLISLCIFTYGKPLHIISELDLTTQTNLKRLHLDLNYNSVNHRFGVEQTKIILPPNMKLETFTTKCIHFATFESLQVADLTLRKFCNNQPLIWSKISVTRSLYLRQISDPMLLKLILSSLQVSELRYLKLDITYVISQNSEFWDFISSFPLEECQFNVDVHESNPSATCGYIINSYQNKPLASKKVILYIAKKQDSEIAILTKIWMHDHWNLNTNSFSLLFED